MGDTVVVDPLVDRKRPSSIFSVQEQSSDLPALKQPKFSHTDTEFHPCLPAYNAFVLLLGGPGSGKTTTLAAMLKSKGYLHKRYNKIWLFNPYPETMNGALPIHPDRQFREFNEENLEHILNAAAEDNLHHLVIFDDMLAELHRNDRMFSRFVWNRRNIAGSKSKREKHEKSGSITVFVTAQNLRRIPACFRDCVTEIMAFKVDGRTLEALNEEFLSDIDPVVTARIRDLCWRGPHDFMYIKRKRQKNGFYKICHNFNPLVIEQIKTSSKNRLDDSSLDEA